MRRLLLAAVFLAPCAAYGETLRVPLISLPGKIVPAEILEVSHAVVANHLFEGLFCYDSANKLSSNLLESFRISPDGKKYTLKVKRGVKFADGTDLTPEAIRASLEDVVRLMGESSRWAFGMLEGFDDFISGRQPHLKGISVASGSEIELRLKAPYSPMLQVFVSPYFRIAAKTRAGYIGTGPYYLAERDDKRIVLKILAWRKKESDIDEIVFEKIASRTDGLSPENLRRYDVIEILSPWKINTEFHNIIDFPYLQANLVVLNTTKGLFAGKAERQRFLNLMRRSVDFNLFGWQLTSAGFPFAKNLFKNAPSRQAEKDWKFTAPVTVHYADSAAVFDQAAIRALQSKIAASGGKVVFVKIPITELVDKFRRADYEAAFLGYIPDIIDPDALFYPLLGTGQQYNFMKYSSRTVDDLLRRGRAESDTGKRFAIYTALTNAIYDEAPMGFLGATKGKMLVSKKYVPPQVNSLGLSGFQLNTLKLKKREDGK